MLLKVLTEKAKVKILINMRLRSFLNGFSRNFAVLSAKRIKPFTHKVPQTRYFSNNTVIEQLKADAANAEKEHGKESEQLATTYNLLGAAYRDVSDMQQAIDCFEKAIKIAEAALGKDHFELTVSYNNLAHTYRIAGLKEKAIENHQKALDIETQTLSQDDPKIGLTLNNLGTLHGDLGNTQKAMEYFEKAYPIMKHRELENDPVVGTFFLNYGTLKKRFAEASEVFECFETARQVFERCGEENKLDLAQSYVHLGLAKWNYGAREEAQKHLEKAIQIREQKSQDLVLADWCNKLGTLLNNSGNFEGAIFNFTKAIKLSESQKNPESWMYHNNIGNAYRAKSDIPNAQSNLEEALKLASENYGELSKPCFITLENLSAFYNSQNNFEAALEAIEKALTIRKSIEPQNLNDIATGHYNAGSICYKQGNFEKAKEHFQSAKELIKNFENRREDVYINVLSNHALNLKELKDFDTAKKSLFEAVSVASRAFGEKHISVAELYNNLGLLHVDLEDYDKAVDYHSRSVELAEEVLGRDLQTAQYLDFLGDAYRTKLDFDSALESHGRALEIRMEKVGNNRFIIGASYHNLAHDYKFKGKLQDAMELHKRALEIYIEALGENHPYVGGSYVLIAEVSELLQQKQEALQNLSKAKEILSSVYDSSTEVIQEINNKIQKLSS